MSRKFYARLSQNLISLLSLFIFLMIAELLCRAFNSYKKFNTDFKFFIRNVDNNLVEVEYNIEDSLLMWKLKPNYNAGFIKINSAGFRDKERIYSKDKDIFRILCLGDSSTFGVGVPSSQTYSSFLENALNEKFSSSGRRFEVINGGVNGYASAQGLGLYKYKGIRYHPDMVTFYFGINDPIKRFYQDDDKIMRVNVPVAIRNIENNYLLRISSYRLFRKIVLTLHQNTNKVDRPNIPRVSLNSFKNNIIELNNMCRINNTLLVLILPPLCIKKRPNWPRAKDIIPYIETLKEISREYSIPLIEINEMSYGSGAIAEGLFQDIIHPNREGHKRIMEKLYDFILVHKLF